MKRRILNGWKEIGSHLERGARTAQRWELQFGMPVHRPASRRRTAVVAFADELNHWLVRNRAELARDAEKGIEEASPAELREKLLRLQLEAKELAAKLSHLEKHIDESAWSGEPKPGGLETASDTAS